MKKDRQPVRPKRYEIKKVVEKSFNKQKTLQENVFPANALLIVLRLAQPVYPARLVGDFKNMLAYRVFFFDIITLLTFTVPGNYT